MRFLLEIRKFEFLEGIGASLESKHRFLAKNCRFLPFLRFLNRQKSRLPHYIPKSFPEPQERDTR